MSGSSAAVSPLLVFVHGGGWRIGHRRAPRETREWSEGFFDRLCSAGFVVAAVSYRFSGEALFPAQIDDVVDAIRWLHDHADELGIARSGPMSGVRPPAARSRRSPRSVPTHRRVPPRSSGTR